MPTVFISDLHLAADQPETAAAFFRFMEGPARRARALYILGDLFELWTGDEFADDFERRVMDAIATLTASGVQVFVMTGNRDFMMGRQFGRETGATMLPDPSLLDIEGHPVLLMHGDSLCTDDQAYQAFRRKRDHPITRIIIRFLPLAVRRKIAASLRRQSEQAKMNKSAGIMDVNGDAVAGALRHHGVSLLIHGHTHRPARHEHLVDGRSCERWVLPDWHGKAVWLECDSQGYRFREVDAPQG